MRIDLSHYGSPLVDNNKCGHLDIDTLSIKNVQIEVDTIFILLKGGKMIKIRFMNKRFQKLFIRRIRENR